MKFVFTYTNRAGSNAADNLENLESSQKLLSTWKPSEVATIREWVQRCDGNGGFSVVEVDNPDELYRDLVTWSPWFEFQVFPVIDVLQVPPLNIEAISVAKSAF